MFDQVLESFHKASESTLQTQQDLFKQWMQQWHSVPLNATGTSAEHAAAFQKRYAELVVEVLEKHRELLDSMYRSGIRVMEQTFHISDAKSPDDYRRLVGELWNGLSESVREQSELQFRELQHASEKWFAMAKSGEEKSGQEST
ncbi:MAG TPA: hypothetical protein VG963_06065 [Polyangiaceae bacterium]|nr:hypothetical protein [Polyangiaceae bacterium]